MTTINIHKDKLLPAAFAYQQRAMLHTHNSSSNEEYHLRSVYSDIATREFLKIQTACRVAEDGIVSLDIDVVQRIFGEE